MDQRRKFERIRAFLGAQIVFNDRRSTIDCMVRNWSDEGAMLDLSETIALPEVFELVVPQKGFTSLVRLRWRATTRVGVSFFNGQDAPPDEVIAVLRARIAELERENGVLSRQLAERTSSLVD